MDSFDHYAAGDFTEKWTSQNNMTLSAGGGRRSTAAAQFNSFLDYLRKTLDAQATWIVGFALKLGSAGSGVILSIVDGTTEQCFLYVNANGTLSLYRGPFSSFVLLGTSTYALSTGLYYYVELKLTIHDTTGSFEVRVDGVNRLSGSNVDTKGSANANANGIAFGNNVTGSSNGHQDFYIDDLYVCDGQGAANNDFLGDCRVDSYLPTADGANTGLTPSSGTTHFSLVDEVAPNDDTDYNESATLGAKDTYGFADIVHNPASVFGIQINLSVRKDDAGFRQVKDVVRSGGTDFAGAAQALGTSYGYKLAVREVDPATGAPWTKAGVNNAEFGMEVA
jgi:hypothetical protein